MARTTKDADPDARNGSVFQPPAVSARKGASPEVSNNTMLAAAVLVGLGRDSSRDVFRHLSEQELRTIARGARALRQMPSAAVPEALQIFVDTLSQVGVDAAGGDELLSQWVSDALGPDVARRAFGAVTPATAATSDEGLGSVANADPESLGMVLAREHPQTIALVLSAIDVERAMAVMDHIPEELHSSVILRMATVEAVVPELLREVGSALASELHAITAGGVKKVNGRQSALEILRRRPSDKQTAVVSEIEKWDANLANDLRAKMFTFEDVVHLTDRDIQSLLKEFDTRVLCVALKGASPRVSEKILRNMSSRASQMLRDDLAVMPPVRIADVEKAQEQLVTIVTKLAREGRITVVGPADKMV